MLNLRYKYIAIDFDDTIATDNYPDIGGLIPYADVVIRKIKQYGGKIAIWTCRCGEDEIKVKKFLEKHNIPWDAFNEPFPEIYKAYGGSSRKIYADVYIDDKGIHTLNKGIDWLEIDKLLFIYPELKSGDILVCIKNGMNGFANIGQRYKITKILNNYGRHYVIDDVVATSEEIISEYFRKV